MNKHLQAFIGHLAAEVGASGNTIMAYRRDVESLAAWLDLNNQALTDARPEDLRQYVACQTLAGKSSATINRRITSLRLFYAFIGKDVANDLERPNQVQSLPRTLNREQVNKLIATPLPDVMGRRDRAVLELLYASGLRATELCELREADVNLHGRMVRVMGKGDKERIVPMHQSAVDAINRYLEHSRPALDKGLCNRLFLSRTGRAFDRHALWHLVARHAKASGLLNEISPHTLRHCFATQLISGGADLITVQELLGHASVETTQIYIHVDADRLKAVHAAYHPRP